MPTLKPAISRKLKKYWTTQRHLILRSQLREGRDTLFTIRRDFNEMAQLGKEFKEREDNKQIYDAIKAIKTLKFTEIDELLAPALESVGYVELGLDKPQAGKFLVVAFSCLDSKVDRQDSNSRDALKSQIQAELSNTNCRLVPNSIGYRLGYLSGQIRAYENEQDLITMIKTTVPNDKKSS